MKSYPVVETVQRDNICHTVIVPADISSSSEAIASKLALDAIATFDGAGIFGVEMFLLPDGEVILNEIAPRPHNSGHYTMEACVTDQFEQVLRAILGMPLGDTSLRVGFCKMINILGDGDEASTMRSTGADACLSTEGASMHWYGKLGCKLGRKMGHITVTAPTLAELDARVAKITSVPSS
jgi:phosphoribosylaminoimidazole carboxylase